MTPNLWFVPLLLASVTPAGAQRAPEPGDPIAVVLERQRRSGWDGPVFLLYDDGTVITSPDSAGALVRTRLSTEQLAELKSRIAAASGACPWKPFYRMMPEDVDQPRIGSWSLYLPRCPRTSAVVVRGWVYAPSGPEARYRRSPDLETGLPAGLASVLRLLLGYRGPPGEPWRPPQEYRLVERPQAQAGDTIVPWPASLPQPDRWVRAVSGFRVPLPDAQQPLVDSLYRRLVVGDVVLTARGKAWDIYRSPAYPGEAIWQRAFNEVEVPRPAPERRRSHLFSFVLTPLALILAVTALGLATLRLRRAR